MAFTLRPSVEQQAAWSAAAEGEGRSLANWIGRVCDEAAGSLASATPVGDAIRTADKWEAAVAKRQEKAGGCPLPSPGFGVKCKACGLVHK